MSETNVAMEMPKYECHKQVWALKIRDIWVRNDGSSYFTPEDTQYSDIDLSEDYVNKHHPEDGGYYVVYKDGYKSYSPADAFEDGYSKV